MSINGLGWSGFESSDRIYLFERSEIRRVLYTKQAIGLSLSQKNIFKNRYILSIYKKVTLEWLKIENFTILILDF